MSESDSLAGLRSFLKPGTTGVAKRFDYYDNWKNEIFTCPYCGWTGKIDQMEWDECREKLDASCPQCWTMLTIVSYPNYRSTKDAAEAGNPEAIRELIDGRQSWPHGVSGERDGSKKSSSHLISFRMSMATA